MGTTLSILPTYDYMTQEWSDVGKYFKAGLNASANLNEANVPKIDNDESVISKQADSRSRSGILRKESEYNPPTVSKPQNDRKSRSRLPTPVNKDNQLDGNKNKMENRSEAASFRPESWPTDDIVRAHMKKRESQPTTMIFARFAPRNSLNFVEIGYSTNDSGERGFNCSGKLDSLIPSKEGHEMGETKEQKMEYFLKIFKACINSLQGQVWWNGFSLILDKNVKKRLKVNGLEVGPSQMLLELTNMKDLEIYRKDHRVELRGQSNQDGAEEDIKYLRIRGQDAFHIKISQLRGNLITVHVPDFN